MPGFCRVGFGFIDFFGLVVAFGRGIFSRDPLSAFLLFTLRSFLPVDQLRDPLPLGGLLAIVIRCIVFQYVEFAELASLFMYELQYHFEIRTPFLLAR